MPKIEQKVKTKQQWTKKEIQKRMVENLTKADAELGKRVAQGMKLI